MVKPDVESQFLFLYTMLSILLWEKDVGTGQTHWVTAIRGMKKEHMHNVQISEDEKETSRKSCELQGRWGLLENMTPTQISRFECMVV